MGSTRREAVPVRRLEGGDRMEWQSDVGPVPQNIAALLLLDGARRDVDVVVREVEDRLGRLDLLRRHPEPTPWGSGGWIWVDDPPGTRGHVVAAVASGPGRDDLVDDCLRLATRRFRLGRAPWAVHVLTGPDGRVVAMVLVLHHVLADAATGLAVLAALAGAAPAGDDVRVTPRPSAHALRRDAWRRRGRLLRELPVHLRALPGAWEEIGRGRVPSAARSALNRPTGPRREAACIDLEVAALRSVGRRYGGSTNDALLVAAGEALAEVARRRGDELDRVIVSVPVAVPDDQRRADVGNTVGVLPLPVPVTGPLHARVAAVAADRRARLAAAHGRSAPLVTAVFSVVHGLGLVRWWLDHQRLLTTLATTVVGPPEPFSLLGMRVDDVVPVVINQGNIAVAFATFRYAGHLSVTVVSDPDAIPAREVADALVGAVARLTSPA